MQRILLSIAILCAIAWGQKLINGNRVQVGNTNACTSTSGSDDYNCQLEENITALVPGMEILMTADVANVTTATIDVSGLGPQSIVKPVGGVTTALDSNDIRASQKVKLVYDGTNFQMMSLLGNAPTSATGNSVLTGSPNAVVASGATRYSSDITWNATESAVTWPFPATGTFSNLYMRTTTAQSG